MDDDAIERARERLRFAAEGRTEPAAVETALERAREGIEGLAETAANLEGSLPARVGEAVREGVRAEALPVARQIAEVRGLAGLMIRRLERLEGEMLSEQHSRVDDLSLLVDLITSGWQSVDERLTRMERNLQSSGGAMVYRIEERRTGSTD